MEAIRGCPINFIRSGAVLDVVRNVFRGTRGFPSGIVIALKATESQIVISIINDDMRICSTVTEGILC
jgi:hypothetical protein